MYLKSVLLVLFLAVLPNCDEPRRVCNWTVTAGPSCTEQCKFATMDLCLRGESGFDIDYSDKSYCGMKVKQCESVACGGHCETQQKTCK